MTRTEQIQARLQENLAPRELKIIDESEKHIGHSGYQEGGESHFRVIISAEELDGLSRIERHRSIHSALGKALMSEIHALAIEIIVPFK